MEQNNEIEPGNIRNKTISTFRNRYLQCSSNLIESVLVYRTKKSNADHQKKYFLKSPERKKAMAAKCSRDRRQRWKMDPLKIEQQRHKSAERMRKSRDRKRALQEPVLMPALSSFATVQ